jgi:hypothetical protein
VTARPVAVRVRQVIALVAITAFVPGIAAALEVTGQSTATKLLGNDILMHLLPTAQAALGCDRVDSIVTTVLTLPTVEEKNADGVVIRGHGARERWVAGGCGRQVAYLVTFTPDGKGGSYWNVARDK